MQLDEILDILLTGRGVSYDGEPVDELSHALQCAALARASGAGDELAVAALLHDVGRAPAVSTLFPGWPHERAGSEVCRELFGNRVAWLVGEHVRAKRYLVAVEAGYAGSLSPASLKSLVQQGGCLTTSEVRQFQADKWHADAVRLRRWDDTAKVPGAQMLSLDDVAALLRRVAFFAGSLS